MGAGTKQFRTDMECWNGPEFELSGYWNEPEDDIHLKSTHQNWNWLDIEIDLRLKLTWKLNQPKLKTTLNWFDCFAIFDSLLLK